MGCPDAFLLCGLEPKKIARSIPIHPDLFPLKNPIFTPQPDPGRGADCGILPHQIRENYAGRNNGLRSFMAVLGDQDVGIFVSIGGFTTDAESEARTQEKRKISLIGLEKLFDLWVENYSKISEEFKKLLPLRPVYFLEPKI